MGFFSAMRLTSLYEKRIKAFGFEPRSLPPDLHSTICSSFERRAEKYADMCGMTGSHRAGYIEVSMEGAAELVVLCCIGPTLFVRKGGHDPSGVISEVARTLIASGLEGSLEVRLVQAINQAGYLNEEFAHTLQNERMRQKQLTTST